MSFSQLDGEFLYHNPLDDPSLHTKIANPCILVIFGATGDLTARKLIPALYNLAFDAQLPAHFACVGFARRPKTDEEFRQEMREAISTYSRNKPIDEALFETFASQLFYHCSEFHDDEGYLSLKTQLAELDNKFGTKGNRLFYLSTQPSFFPLIVEKLHEHHLIYDANEEKDRFSRVIIEKPFGHDFKSAVALQEEVSRNLDESQVFRIDHYLGKETVQNLLVFRFCNPIFEQLWNNHFIDHIQITVSEELGIGTRGRLWEESGMLRDIVQNHMMQLLSLVLMDPPVNLSSDAIRNEKVKVLESIRPIGESEVDKFAVRGQYSEGLINGKAVIGYRQEENVSPTSNVETYVALKLFVDNWRWAGVPIYLRAGKRLVRRATEIAITFKEAPKTLYELHKSNPLNVLAMKIQPNEGISLKINCKVPGMSQVVQPVKMDFLYGSYFGSTPPEAYERLLCDCMAGDTTLFARSDEVLASWKLLTPILKRWEKQKEHGLAFYPAGSWGPESAEKLFDANRSWRVL